MIFSAFLLQSTAYAQKVDNLSEEQIRQFIEQAKKSRMSEAQIEQLALTRGFAPSDIKKMRAKVTELSKYTPQELQMVSMGESREQTDKASLSTAVAPLSRPEAAENKLTVFGANLFANANLTFEPNLRIPTPKNYQIGPDDELIIDVYGNAQRNYHTKVSPEGAVKLENLSPIYVNGLTIEQAEQRIIGRLRQVYAGLNTTASGIFASVSLGSIRSIKVTLIGQVVKPGTYTLSSLATVFNALYVSGGPDPDRGSFRDIRVYRGNRLVRTLDIYDFLLRADQKDNIRLQDQDIVFINHYDTRVQLTGEVKQPAIYEVQKGELLKNLLAFAGGFTEKAYTASLTLRRNTPKELQVITVPAADIPAFLPQRGDLYTVGAIIDRYENRVTINGAVFRPGIYALQKNASLRQLITTAEGLREDAFLNRATIRRLRENLDPALIGVDLGKLMRDEVPDIVLQREDVIDIPSYGDLRENRVVTILGAVNRPGPYAYADSMSVASLIVLAGGFTDGATASRVEIARRVRKDTAGLPQNQNVRIFQFELNERLRLTEADARFTLSPFDQVFVRKSPRYEAQKTVALTGEVRYPGAYSIRDKSERITDLIERAGGLRSEAYLKATRFTRNRELVSVNLSEIIARPSDSGNLLLLEGDSIHIPRKTELVKIRGEVLNPSVVDFNYRKSIRAYINEAGGFNSKALRRKLFVIYANGKVNRTRGFLGVRDYPDPEPGMEVVVPSKPPKTESRLSSAERIAVMTGITSLAAVVLTIIRLF
ncbi:SLBB domain-containing protein [Larkinella insperata]|uniref:SLBB domain-containing protein n=1 Tax=Larkinella insperata TaxID=332158 RepID=A0ABW3QJJ3_9BACT|nr:SLBB domain-containing protein [Larkinella insperata]